MKNQPAELRRLGTTEIFVTPIAMGAWPISGITSVDVNTTDSLATLAAAFDEGINFFDTAYCYGYEGESEQMIGRVLGSHRHEIVLATKGGIHWVDAKQIKDGSPATLRRQCEESLRRLQTDYVDLLYLHAPDPGIPIAESASALRELLDAGKTRSVGVSNASVEQLQEFESVCPVAAFQPHYNMLQREVELTEIPWCVAREISVIVYWPLMKGLLAGKLPRDHVFDVRDGRRKYPMFHGAEWERNQDFLDELRPIATETGKSIAQLVLNWTIHRRGICGRVRRKRPGQIRDNAGGMGWQLKEDQLARIDAALRRRGTGVSRGAI